eukprot:m.52925 g.52925  ORF g.52925 m.52925 type:complete len:788 (-) comp12339_c0_seq2:25-2388(-)
MGVGLFPVLAAMALAVAAFGHGPAAGGGASAAGGDTLPWFDPSLPREQRAKALVSAMTPQEKVANLVVDAPAMERLGVPSYHWRSNVLHGLVSNGPSTMFPQATGMAATFDVGLIQEAATVMSTEQRAKHNVAIAANKGNSPMDYGLDLWGPNINMFRDPRWGRGQETYGECPKLTGTLAAAFVRGLQQGPLYPKYLKTVATPKHFDAYSVDRMPPRLSFDPNITKTALEQYYFPAFRAVVNAGCGSIMCSYNGINGYPMCMSPMLADVLRKEMNFTGYIVTDSGALEFMVSKFHRFNNTTEAAIAGLDASVDLNSGNVFLKLGDALSSGRVTEEQLDTALTRLFMARLNVGLFDPPSLLKPYSDLGNDDILTPANLATARSVADNSLVLLRNTPLANKQTQPSAPTAAASPLLPLSLGKGKTLAVIGPAANDTYRMVGNYYGCTTGAWGKLSPNCTIKTVLEGVQDAFQDATVAYTQGCEQESSSTTGFADAVALAKQSDVVIMALGLRNCEGGQGHGGANCESEGHDRDILGLPGVQQQLLEKVMEANSNVVLVLLNGGPVSIPWAAQHVPSILEAWYGGETGADAIGAALNGTTNPSGRLPFTVVESVQNLPDELSMALKAPPHGRTYRHFDTDPLYAFGFGLSYSEFSLSVMHVTPTSVPASAGTSITACVNVTNSPESKFAGRTVVQAYVALDGGESEGLPLVPIKELVGFVKTAELAPGASAAACIEFSTSDFQLADANGALRVPAGKYTLSVGTTAPGSCGKYVDHSAVPPPLSATLTVG